MELNEIKKLIICDKKNQTLKVIDRETLDKLLFTLDTKNKEFFVFELN